MRARCELLIEVAGEDRVLLGSDYPFDMGLDDPVATIRSAGLPDDVTRRILGDNAAALLRGARPVD